MVDTGPKVVSVVLDEVVDDDVVEDDDVLELDVELEVVEAVAATAFLPPPPHAAPKRSPAAQSAANTPERSRIPNPRLIAA